MRISTHMRSLYRSLLVALLAALLYSPGASAQFCLQSGLLNMGDLTSSISTIQQPVNVPNGVLAYWTFNAIAGVTYTFGSCGASEDTYMRIYSGSDPATATQVAYADDYGPLCSGTAASIGWTCGTSGTYTVLLTRFSCGPLNNALVFTYQRSGAACSGVPTAGTVSVSGTGANCGYATRKLTVSNYSQSAGNIAIQWQSSPNGTTFSNIAGANLPTYTTPSISTTTYYRAVVTCTNSNQTATTNAVTVTVNPLPNITVTPATAVICTGNSTTLTASGANTYAWSTGATGASQSLSPAATTYYQVTGTNTATGCSNTKLTAVFVRQHTVAPTASPNAVCSGGSTQLNANISNAPATTGYRQYPIAYAPIATPGTGVTVLATNKTLTVPTTGGNLGDGYWGNIAVPFTFQYYGVGSSAVQISTNGHVYMLGGTDADVISRSNPIGVYPDGSYDGRAFPLGSDPNLTHGGTVAYFTTGTAPNRAFVINYKDVVFDNNEAGVGNVQMIIKEGTSAIEFHTGITTNVASPKTQGLISPDGNTASLVIGRNGADVWTGYPDAVRFVPVAPLNISWTPAGTLDNAAIANPVASNITANTTYNVTVTDPGINCSQSGSASVTVKPNGQWTGATSTAWSTASNWCGGVPTASTDALIPGAATLTNSPAITGSVSVKNLTLQSGASLTLNSNAILSINGAMSNAGNFNGTSGTLAFTGTAVQTIPGGMTIGGLAINGGSTKSLGGNLTVNGNLTFLNGVLSTGLNTLTLGSSSTITGASATSYVRTVATGGGLQQPVGSTPVVFPVGNTTYNPATLTNAGTADNFTVRVRNGVLTEGSSGGAISPTNTYAVNRTWYIQEAVAGGSNVTMSLQWSSGETNSPSFDYSHVYISHYSGASWDSPYPLVYTAPPAGGYPGAGPYTATRSGITSFSPFTVGSAGGVAPLPVTLAHLEAFNDGSRNRIAWESATELSLAAYIVERSADGAAFERMDEMSAHGKAGSYAAYDNAPENGFTYYRLKMVEADGSFAYSPVVKAFVTAHNELALTAMPNPVHDLLTVQVFGATTGDVQLMDITGRQVALGKVQQGTATFAVGGLSAGAYFVRFSNGAAAKTIQVNKQ